MTELVAIIRAAVAFGTVIMFGAVGEIITEKSGNLNLGVPGIMYFGGIAGLMGVFFYENSCNTAGITPSAILCMLIAIGCAAVACFLVGLLYSFLTTTLRANQNVTGLAITIFGGGFANFFGGYLNKIAGGVGQISVSATSSVFTAYVPGLRNLGFIGETLLSYGFMVYLAIVIAIASSYFLNRTRVGLNLRAVGESPATADAAGINVTKYKYLATCFGAVISGMGGLYYVMDYTKGTWSSDGKLEALGWLAVALVIFARWKPIQSIWGAYLFGILSCMYFYISGLTRSSLEIFKMLPYAVTIIVLVVVSMKKRRENQPPESLGLAYFREER